MWCMDEVMFAMEQQLGETLPVLMGIIVGPSCQTDGAVAAQGSIGEK